MFAPFDYKIWFSWHGEEWIVNGSARSPTCERPEDAIRLGSFGQAVKIQTLPRVRGSLYSEIPAVRSRIPTRSHTLGRARDTTINKNTRIIAKKKICPKKVLEVWMVHDAYCMHMVVSSKIIAQCYIWIPLQVVTISVRLIKSGKCEDCLYENFICP